MVLDAQGRANQAGAEVRVYVAGTFELLGSALVDTGSGYDAQNLLPVHFGLPGAQPVDIEVTLVGGGKRVTTRAAGVDPTAWRGRVIRLPFDEEGNLVR
jgi:hypothetical protein